MMLRLPLVFPARLRRRPAPAPPAKPAVPLRTSQQSVPKPTPKPPPTARPRPMARHVVPTDSPTGPLAGRAIEFMSATELADRNHGPHRTTLCAEDAVLARLAEAGGDLTAHRLTHLEEK